MGKINRSLFRPLFFEIHGLFVFPFFSSLQTQAFFSPPQSILPRFPGSAAWNSGLPTKENFFFFRGFPFLSTWFLFFFFFVHLGTSPATVGRLGPPLLRGFPDPCVPLFFPVPWFFGLFFVAALPPPHQGLAPSGTHSLVEITRNLLLHLLHFSCSRLSWPCEEERTFLFPPFNCKTSAPPLT